MPSEEIQLIEDIGIYIILIFIVINTFIMWIWMRRQSKKADLTYDFIKNLAQPELKEENK